MARLPSARAQRQRQKIRERLRQQAEAAARRENAPDIRAARAQVRGARHDAAHERNLIKQASTAAMRAVSHTSLKGLRGPYKHDLARELSSRKADIAAQLPALVADANAESRATIADARTGLLEARLGRQTDAATKYNSALDEARNARGVIEVGDPSGDKAKPKPERNALIHARDYLARIQAARKKGKKVSDPFESRENLAAAAIDMEHNYEGVTAPEALRALHALQERFQRMLRGFHW